MKSQFFDIALGRTLLWRSVKIAAIVGTIYNVINQGDIAIAGKFDQLNFIKMGLTYMTPFFVATYSATMTKMKMLKEAVRSN